MIGTMLTEPASVEKTKIPDVVQEKKQLMAEVTELKDWAGKFGLSVGGKKKRKAL